MNFFLKILTSLGFCPSKKDASGFKPSLQDILSINPTQYLKPQSLLLLILLSTGGYWAFSTIMLYNTRTGAYPPSTFEIVLYSLRFLWGASLVLLTLDVYLSKKISIRHYIESSVLILVSGFSNFDVLVDFLEYLSYINKYPYMNFSWKVALQMNENFISYAPMLIAFVLAYRVFRKKPLFVKSTYLLLIVHCLSWILWLMSINSFSPLSLSSPWALYILMMNVLSVATLGFALISFLQGYLGIWSKEELFTQGIPWIFKVAMFTYGLRQLVSMSTLLITQNSILDIFSNSQVLFSVVARLTIGISSIILSMTRWNLSTILPKKIGGGTERGVELSDEVRGLPPSKLALHIFSQIIPELVV